ALAVLTRPTFLLFYVASWVWLLLAVRRRAGSWSRPAAGLLAGLLGFALLAAPVAEGSRRATGRFGFLASSGGLNAYIGNNPDSCETLTVRPGLEWGELVDLPARHGHIGMAERNRFFLAQVGEFASEQPGAFLAGLGGKALRVISSRELPRNLDVYFAGSWSGLLSALTWKVGDFGFPLGLLLPLAAVGLVLRRRRVPAPIWLFVTLYPLAIVLVFVAARYRAPTIPVLSVAAAAGLFRLLDLARRRDWRRVGLAAAIVVGGSLLVTLPGPFCEEHIDGEADFYYCLGHAQGERGRAVAAIASYERALAANPDLEQVHYNLGLLRARDGDLETAARHYREALRIDPGFARAHNNLGALLERRGRPGEAVPHFAEAARLEPRLLVAGRNLAKALLRTGKSTEARAAIRAVIEAEPDNAEDRFVLGSAHLQSGDPAAAVAELRRAIELGGEARAHNELGVALLGLGDLPQAVEQFRQAIELSPDYLDAYSNAGAALAMAGDLDEARRFLAEAVRRSPEAVGARYNLATILLQLGEVDGAIAELRAILALRPEHARARGRLRELIGED
ncbi:MAG: tetratricopeptide repeat protein, partial [Thermoanaerobaculia bacterium]